MQPHIPTGRTDLFRWKAGAVAKRRVSELVGVAVGTAAGQRFGSAGRSSRDCLVDGPALTKAIGEARGERVPGSIGVL